MLRQFHGEPLNSVEDYIHQMAVELAELAAHHRLSTVHYLLSMAAMEVARTKTVTPLPETPASYFDALNDMDE